MPGPHCRGSGHGNTGLAAPGFGDTANRLISLFFDHNCEMSQLLRFEILAKVLIVKFMRQWHWYCTGMVNRNCYNLLQ